MDGTEKTFQGILANIYEDTSQYLRNLWSIYMWAYSATMEYRNLCDTNLTHKCDYFEI